MSARRMALRASVGVVALCLAAAGTGAQAQPQMSAGAQSDTVEPTHNVNGDVVVTASKRDEKLRDVPSAITVLDGNKLDNLGVRSVRDYATLTPGLTVQEDGNPGSGKVFIRGLQTGALQQSATTVFYLDDVPFTSSSANGGGAFIAPDTELVDLDRIEVLKGPQGTLYGASSLGGVIRLISKRPDPSRFSGSARTEVSAVDGGGVGYLANATINLPLVSDRLALRATGFYRRLPGFVDNIGTGSKNVNESDSKGVRLALGWTPSSRLTIDVVGQLQDTDTKGLTLQDDVPGTFTPLYGHRQYSQFFDAPAKVRYRLVSATGRYDVGIGRIIATGAYSESRLHTENDFSTTYVPLFPLFGLLGFHYPANTGAAYENTIPQKKSTAELRFVSNRLGPIEFIVGGFYTHERASIATDIVARDIATNRQLPAPLGSILSSPIEDTYEELSAFGNMTVYLKDNLDITGGVRFANYKEDFSLVYSGVSLGGATLATPERNIRDDNVSYLATLRWRPTNNLSLFLRAASGFRPGGPQPAIIIPPGGQTEISPDTVWNFEAGIKGDFLDKRLSLEASVFHIDWNNIQLYTNYQNQALLANAGKAKVDGFEIAALVRPNDLLTVGANAGYSNARLTEVDPGVSAGAIGAAVGDPIPQTPRWTVSVTADQLVPLGGDLQGQLGATLRFQSEWFTSFPGSVVSPDVKLPSIATVDLRAGVSFQRYQVQFRVENVLNEAGLLNYAPGLPGTPATANIIRPRSFTLSLSTRF
ncbi:TonB-dependent receptor [Sphingomonas lycopersici]|uniref:TonB-dependent receptor n=1 Tax=Sphingomonas lycopersici TaxID=2951807 RepID=UPI002237B7D8|nr:TonB-dependent receptor [Sphingomonas lycopersici]